MLAAGETVFTTFFLLFPTETTLTFRPRDSSSCCAAFASIVITVLGITVLRGPFEIRIVTLPPLLAVVPPAGLCEITANSGTVSLNAYPASTEKPASFNSFNACNYITVDVEIKSATETLLEVFSHLASCGKTQGIIKIDVEGHELEVLLGGDTLIKKNCPIILFEQQQNEIIQLLHRYFYQSDISAEHVVQQLLNVQKRQGQNGF